MRTSYRSIEPKGIEDYLKDLCKVYRGEEDNPHDVNATNDADRAIQFLVGYREEYNGEARLLAIPSNRASRKSPLRR